VRLVGNLTAECNESITKLHGFVPGLQTGIQARHLTADNSCYLSGEEAKIGTPEVDDKVVAFATSRLQGRGGEKLCDAVLITGGPPCQAHSGACQTLATQEELDESMKTVKSFLRIVKRIKDAAAALQDGPLVAFVMENPAGTKENSMDK
jgi:hypothetical protein